MIRPEPDSMDDVSTPVSFLSYARLFSETEINQCPIDQ